MRLIKHSNTLHELENDNVTVWFSYETPIAFFVQGVEGRLIVSENIWSRTTAKHINQVKSTYINVEQVDNEEFVEALRIYGR